MTARQLPRRPTDFTACSSLLRSFRFIHFVQTWHGLSNETWYASLKNDFTHVPTQAYGQIDVSFFVCQIPQTVNETASCARSFDGRELQPLEALPGRFGPRAVGVIANHALQESNGLI